MPTTNNSKVMCGCCTFIHNAPLEMPEAMSPHQLYCHIVQACKFAVPLLQFTQVLLLSTSANGYPSNKHSCSLISVIF